MPHVVGIQKAAELIKSLKDGIIVSCQAPDGSPINHPQVISAMALVAEQQGTVAVRINGVKNIQAVRRRVKVPIIGIEKLRVPGYPVYITPNFASASRVVKAGSDVVAMDFTAGKRPGGQSLAEIVQRFKRHASSLLLADVASVEQGVRAEELGADLVATTLFGYTEATNKFSGPAFQLLRELVRKLTVPVILEGRVRSTEDVKRGFDLGAHAVVAGTAVTDIQWLVHRFVAAAPRVNGDMSRAEIE